MTESPGTNIVTRAIEVHQLLHGYGHGHQRVAGSLVLGRHTERTILLLSDMSGPNMVPGFESYLTGYPLDEDRKYAISRTWYAPEMPRPGSVWTHTLVFEAKDVGLIREFDAVNRLFRRPESLSDSQAYQAPLSLNVDIFGRPEVWYGADPAPLLEALYGSLKPVMLSELVDSENLVASVWLQQWPSLRQCFCFCTGSLANRTLDGLPFDLQVVPQKREAQIRRASGSGVIVRLERTAASAPQWARKGASDLRGSEGNRFRDFLAYFGSDVIAKRLSYFELATVFADFVEPQRGIAQPDVLLRMIAAWFRSSADARRLKAWIFGPPLSDELGWRRPFGEVAVLSALVSFDDADALEPEDLDVEKRASLVALEDPEKATALSILAVEATSRLRDDLLKGMARVASQAPKYLRLIPDAILAELVARDWTVLCAPDAWRAPHNPRSVAEYVDVRSLARPQLSRYFEAMVSARATEGVQQLVERAPIVAVQALIDTLLADSRFIDSQEELWAVSATHRVGVLAWIDEPNTNDPVRIVRVLRLISPTEDSVLSHGTETWINLLRLVADQPVGSPARIELTTFSLAVGLGDAAGRPYDLVAASFELVHDALESGRVNSPVWSLVEPLVAPSTSWWWRRDDRPYRLRIALIEAFSRRQWPLTAFFSTFRQQGLLLQCLLDAADTKQGRKFRENVERVITEGPVPPNVDAQRVRDALGVF